MNPAFHIGFRYLPVLALAALLPACKSVPIPSVPGITPYRMVIQQGNFISQEMVAQLKPGMSKEQVRFILGTPLVTDIFHADRWDYVFYRDVPGEKRVQRNLSVVFEKEKLARVIGDLMPPEGTVPQATGFVPQVKPAAEAPKPAAAAPKPEAEAPKPAVEAANTKPGEGLEPPKQNWGTAAAEPEKKPEPAPDAAADTKKAEEPKPAEEKKERGVFGRMLEKIGL